MLFTPIRPDIIDHLEKYLATKGADCEHAQILIGSKVPKSSFIARILKTKILPPCSSTVVFSLSKYTSPSENRLAYIESDGEEKSDSEVVESSHSSSEDGTSSSEDIDDDEPHIVSLIPMSSRDELELARMVCTCGRYKMRDVYIVVCCNRHV